MKRFLMALGLCGLGALLFVPTALRGQTTTITATNIRDSGDNLFTGTWCALPAQQFVAGGGNVLPVKICYPVTNGALGTVTLYDTTLTNPKNICYKITIADQYLQPLATYACMQPSGTTYSFDAFVQASPPYINSSFTLPQFQFNGTVVAVQNVVNFAGAGVSYSGGTYTFSGGGSSLPTATAAGQAPVSTSATGFPYAAAQIEPATSTYTFWVTSGTVYARNNATGAVAYSGTDAAVVINDVLGVMATTGGTLYFKNGAYPLASATAETVAPYTTLSYAVGIPSTNAVNYPAFNFVGESAGIGSQVHPAAQGVVFNVTSAAETAAGTNTLAAFWMRPNTVYDTEYPAGTTLYWNDHITFENIAVNFPANTRGNEAGIDALEASYLHVKHVQIGLTTAATALGASGLVAFVTPATPSDGDLIEETQVDPGFWQDYQINTEHSVLINTEAYRGTTCYAYGYAQSRNAGLIYHSSQWIHPQVYDCVNGITAGAYFNAGAQLDILGLDLEYITTTAWAYSTGFTTVNSTKDLAGMLTWNNVQTNVGAGTLTTPFPNANGENYETEANGQFTANTHRAAVIGNGTSTSGAIEGTGIIDVEGYKDATPTEAWSLGYTIPGGIASNNPIFSYYNGSAWNGAWYIDSTTGDVVISNPSTTGGNFLQILSPNTGVGNPVYYTLGVAATTNNSVTPAFRYVGAARLPITLPSDSTASRPTT